CERGQHRGYRTDERRGGHVGWGDTADDQPGTEEPTGTGGHPGQPRAARPTGTPTGSDRESSNQFPYLVGVVSEVPPAQALAAGVPDHVGAEDKLHHAAPDVFPTVPDPDSDKQRAWRAPDPGAPGRVARDERARPAVGQ